MERPWLLLRRVLDVGLIGNVDGLHADAEDGEVVDAEAEAEEHAAVAEAEEDVVAMDAEEEAQEQHAAVAEAEEGAQAQEGEHAGVDDADDADDAGIEAQLELEESLLNVNTDNDESNAAHSAMLEQYFLPDFTIKARQPPFVSSLIAGTHSHPDPARPDMYPYIIAAGRFCLLVHFAVAPSHGTNFAQGPNLGHLVVVRHFVRDVHDGVNIDACAVRVPERPVDDFLDMPPLSNIESVGLVCDQGTGVYLIAELIVTTGAPRSVVVHTRSITGIWEENELPNPLFVADRHRVWVPHGTLAINRTVLWFDLSWGIVSCDFNQPPLLQVLNFHRLPPGRVLLHAGAGVPDIHCRRCIAVSQNLVRYVEIILDDPDQPATVNMWFRDVEHNPWRWETNYRVSFEHIWDHESYAQTELPRTIPVIVGVSPVDSRVVYFSLNQRLFGVNVPEHTVVECQQYEPLRRPGPPDEPATSRYFITWNLDENLAPNVGHQPDDLSDHADSTGSGPADQGEIDYLDHGCSSGSGPAEEGEMDYEIQ